MKYKLLRTFMKKRRLSRIRTLFRTTLVIDGCCFKQMYKNSGCSFILGGEYDRFASYLRNILMGYIQSNIKCYVIFNGAVNVFDIEKRKNIHQDVITRLNGIKAGGDNEYCEPLFTNDVCIDVLKELGIKYYICLNNFKETLLSTARNFKCPIISNKFEYAIYGVSVIAFKSVVYNSEKKCITCTIYYDTICRQYVWKNFTDDMMSLVLTISDEDSDFYNDLLTMFQCTPEEYIINITLCWIRRQSKESALTFIIDNLKEENRKCFLDTFAELRNLFSCTLDRATVAYLLNTRNFISNEYWFEHAVGSGRISNVLVNLKLFGRISGSSLIYHESREEAMLPAIDVALYGLSLLTGTREVDIALIGRKYSACVVMTINKIMNTKVKNRNIRHHLNFVDNFRNFVTEQLPGFDFKVLESVPEDCWIILITLLYYSKKTGRHFTKETYCIILSYVLLGPVSEKVGLINRNNLTIDQGAPKSNQIQSSLTHEQCTQAANSVIDLFCLSESVLRHVFDRDILHTFAEFQHCLHFMNHLNTLCGKKLKCTEYHKAINCTFIYKLFIILKEKTAPGAFIERILKCPPVYSYFKNILRAYYQGLALLILNEIKFV